MTNPDLTYLKPLYTNELRALSIPEPYRFGFADRVRFHELDALNHVNNTTYMTWFETFRLRYLADYKLADYFSKSEQPMIVLRRATIDYLAPLFLDEPYVVAGRSVSYRESSWTMDYAVFARGQLCVTSTAVLVNLMPDVATKKPLTPEMIHSLASRDGAVDARA